MISIDQMCGEMTVPQLLRYHGLHETECPIDGRHELTIASDTYAVCHSCEIEWDIVGLYLHLAGSDNLSDVSDLSEGFELMEDGVPVKSIPLNAGSTPHIEPVAITDDFVSWVRDNRQHIYGLRHFDGHMAAAVAFVTLKQNLCLLPCATENLTLPELRTLEDKWHRHNYIRLPGDRKGVRRSERIPRELQKAYNLSETMRLYTFHRYESLQMLGLPDKHQAG